MDRTEQREKQRTQAAHRYIESDAVDAGNEKLAFGDFINGAKWADQHPQWISVKDDLPKVGASVLFVHPDESEPMEGYMTRTKTWWSEKYRCSFEKVTHWMLMPKPPRKEDKK